MKTQNFKEYQQELFSWQNPTLLDDDLADAFELWLSNLEVEDVENMAEEYGRKQFLLGQASVLKQNEDNQHQG